MKKLFRAAFALLALSLCAPSIGAGPTGLPLVAFGGSVPSNGVVFDNGTGIGQAVTSSNPLPVLGGSLQESIPLITANVLAAATPIYGGDYIAAVSCSSWGGGSVKLRVRGPDGSTFNDLLTKTANDSGTGIALGSYAVVDGTVTTATGCYLSLARVPS